MAKTCVACFLMASCTLLELSAQPLLAQPLLSGKVSSAEGALPGAILQQPAYPEVGAIADSLGRFTMALQGEAPWRIRVSMVGFVAITQAIAEDMLGDTVVFQLTSLSPVLDPVVITGTRTARRLTNNPVAVNVLTSQTLEMTNSQNLAEGLCFQPGLRVETNCQTCNFTQLRMNGLGGGYSQVLINGRPIFSALLGLYGLEFLPAQFVDRVEVVRGGGSVLFGPGAVGGTVNIQMRLPTETSASVRAQHDWIAGRTPANSLNFHAGLVGKNKNMSTLLMGSHRYRAGFDANNDGFTELGRLRQTSGGASANWQLGPNRRLRADAYYMNEHRRGGDNLDAQPHKTAQAEDRLHNLAAATVAYEWQLPDSALSLETYAAAQHTRRDHYTGTGGVPAYGYTRNTTAMGGMVMHFRPKSVPRVAALVGAEGNADDIYDVIAFYDYLVDQVAKEVGVFGQAEWHLATNTTVLAGVRATAHNRVQGPILTPRVQVMQRLGGGFQLRAGYAEGFRPPQAFDADLHIAFAGGGISRVRLSPNLMPELSRSFTASADGQLYAGKWVLGATLAGFHTALLRAFALTEAETDPAGNIVLERRNHGSAAVRGLSAETRVAHVKGHLLELGITIQESRFSDPVGWSSEVKPTREFLRTPDVYGFYALLLQPAHSLQIAASGVLTGPMWVPHFAGAPGVPADRLFRSPWFFEQNLRIAYNWEVFRNKSSLKVFAGVQNMFNAFQSDFDIGPNRDSNYIYGPGRPRTWFTGASFSI